VLKTAVFSIGLLGSVSSAWAWGAIGIHADGYEYEVNERAEFSAKSHVKIKCPGTNKCEIVTFRDQCFAIATPISNPNAFFVYYGRRQEMAKYDALRNCQAYGESCILRQVACDGR
jgi:hypothetical protein